ncbi:MAG: sigma-70 family RNA polymerase sigma factor [Candidatus Pacebacteria bacterium]|nr:sigma-70 family RNA polymerase sigma factor [Candidatus Paceibacterota bacterium]
MQSIKNDDSTSTDEEIIILYKKNPEEALKIIVNRYTSSIYNFTARLANRNDAPDIVQEVFIKIWKNITYFNPLKASFKTWIFTIAKNTTTDFLRKRRSLLFSDMPTHAGGEKDDENINSFAENIPTEELLPDLVLQKLEDSKFLNEVLDKLRLGYKEVLVLHYQEEMTFEEIGKILKKPLNTVKSQHRRAIMELRKILN